MRGGTGNGLSGALLFVTIKGLKKEEKVRFQIKKANGKGNPNTDEPDEQNISGKLVKAEHRIWTYEGEAKDSIVLYLQDRDAGESGETMKLEVSMSGLTRGLINSLLSATEFDSPLFLGVYNNKKGYASLSVALGVDSGGAPMRLDWKYDLEFFNSKVTKETKKVKGPDGKVITKEMNNYMELDEFLINEFKTKVVPLVGIPTSTVTTGVSDQSWPTDKDAPPENNSTTDDLPF